MTRDEIERVALGGAPAALDAATLERVAAGRRATLAVLATAGPVYGVGTGQGHLAGRELDAEEVAVHQRNLLPGRAVGSAPWMATDEARAVMAVRLARFLDGRAGVSPELCAFLAARLDDGFTPAIPRTAPGRRRGDPARARLWAPRRRRQRARRRRERRGRACAIDAARAPLGPYEEGVGPLSNDPCWRRPWRA